MHKRTHCQLAKALLRNENGFARRRYELAFLFGSFQPDCNPLTYLKGSRHGTRFGGHTYANNRAFIEKRAERLRQRTKWHLWQYYTLGKLTHYVADAFTWPHNPDFPEGKWGHHVYEREMRRAIAARMLWERVDRRAERGTGAPLGADLAALHEQYLGEEERGLARDLRYIPLAADLLMARCAPPSREEVRLPAAPAEYDWEAAYRLGRAVIR